MGQTTITVQDATLARFNELRAACKDEHTPEPTQDMMLNSLMDTWDGVDKGHYDTDVPEMDIDALAEQVAGQAVTFDDVKQACRAALRDELPERVLQV